MESNERKTDKYGKGSTKHQVENAARKEKKKKLPGEKKKEKVILKLHGVEKDTTSTSVLILFQAVRLYEGGKKGRREG